MHLTTSSGEDAIWLFFYAFCFVLSQRARIVTVVVMKMYDKIPSRAVVYPLIQFSFTESKPLFGLDSKT